MVKLRLAHQLALLLVALICMSSLSLPAEGQGLPANAVELSCGLDMAGLANVTLDGITPLPVGYFCEIRNSTSDQVIATFTIGHGTEGPPGVFKAGQFDYLLTVNPNPYVSSTISVYFRAYNADSVEASTKHADSQTLTVTGGSLYKIPGWSLASGTTPDDGGDNEDDDQEQVTNPTEIPVSVIYIVAAIAVIAIFVLIFIYNLGNQSKSEGQAKNSKGRRRRPKR